METLSLSYPLISSPWSRPWGQHFFGCQLLFHWPGNHYPNLEIIPSYLWMLLTSHSFSILHFYFTSIFIKILKSQMSPRAEVILLSISPPNPGCIEWLSFVLEHSVGTLQPGMKSHLQYSQDFFLTLLLSSQI